MGWKKLREQRDRLRKAGQGTARNDSLELGGVVGFHQVHHTTGAYIPVIQAHRLILAGVIRRVQPPIAGDEIQTAIAVEITGCDAIPPTGQFVEGSEFRVLSSEFANWK